MLEISEKFCRVFGSSPGNWKLRRKDGMYRPGRKRAAGKWNGKQCFIDGPDLYETNRIHLSVIRMRAVFFLLGEYHNETTEILCSNTDASLWAGTGIL